MDCSTAVIAVEQTMKKYADNLLRVLESMSGRLSQLESSAYTLNHSMEDLKLSLANNHGKFDSNVRSLSNHLTEVQKTVQVLWDKHEIYEARAALIKLQSSNKDPAAKNTSSSFVAEVRVQSKTVDSTVQAQDLSQQRQHLVLASSLSPQFNQVESQMLHYSAAAPQNETNMQMNTQKCLPSSSSAKLQPFFSTHADVKTPQQLQGSYVWIQQPLSMQTMGQPQVLPQSSAQSVLVHQLQSLRLPLDYAHALLPSLPAQSEHLLFPKSNVQVQQNHSSQSHLQYSHLHPPSQGSFEQCTHHSEALPFVPVSQNLPIQKPTVSGNYSSDIFPSVSTRFTAQHQPGQVLPQQVHTQLGPQMYNSSFQRDGPMSLVLPVTQHVHDSQTEGYGSQMYRTSHSAMPI